MNTSALPSGRGASPAALGGLGGAPHGQGFHSVPDYLHFLNTLKMQCMHLKHRVTLEIKQKAKVVLLNAINHQKVKHYEEKAKQLAELLQAVDKGAEEAAETVGVKRVEFEKMQELVKDMLQSKVKLSGEPKKEEHGPQAQNKEEQSPKGHDESNEKKSRKRHGDPYASPDDEIPNKRISIFEHSNANEASHVEQIYEQSESEHFA